MSLKVARHQHSNCSFFFEFNLLLAQPDIIMQSHTMHGYKLLILIKKCPPLTIHCPTSWHKNVISWQKMPQMVWSHMISYIYIKMSSTDYTVPYNVIWWHYNATSWHENVISWQKTPQSDVILPYPDLTMLYSHINIPDRDIIMPHPSIMRPHCVIRLQCRLLVL